MGKVKEFALGKAEELAELFCKKNSIPFDYDFAMEAFGVVCNGIEADSKWDEPWVDEWLTKNLGSFTSQD